MVTFFAYPYDAVSFHLVQSFNPYRDVQISSKDRGDISPFGGSHYWRIHVVLTWILYLILKYKPAIKAPRWPISIFIAGVIAEISKEHFFCVWFFKLGSWIIYEKNISPWRPGKTSIPNFHLITLCKSGNNIIRKNINRYKKTQVPAGAWFQITLSFIPVYRAKLCIA